MSCPQRSLAPSGSAYEARRFHFPPNLGRFAQCVHEWYTLKTRTKRSHPGKIEPIYKVEKVPTTHIRGVKMSMTVHLDPIFNVESEKTSPESWRNKLEKL